MNVKDFINEVLVRKVPVRNLLQNFPRKQYLYSSSIIEEIKKSIVHKNANVVEVCLILASVDGVSSAYTELLCDLVREDWHYSYEDVVTLLGETKDPKAVQCLCEATFIDLQYDDGKSLVKKCIWSLGMIGTENARQKLTLLLESDDQIVRDAAQLQLNELSK